MAFLPLFYLKISFTYKMQFICEFCENTFTTKNGLSNHQRKARYCLVNRGKNVPKYTCEGCGKEFTEKRYLDTHEEKCYGFPYVTDIRNKLLIAEKTIIKLTQQNQDYKKAIKIQQEQISDLQNKLENVAIQGVKKSTTTTHNTINLQPLTKEWMDAKALLLTEEHLSNGAVGLAQFAVDNSFKDRVVCTDITRKSLKYKENDGKVSKDPRGKKLSKMFFESIEAKAENIIPTMIERIKEEMDDAAYEDTENTFESVCNKMDEIIKVKKGIKHITKGQEHELKEEFTRQLCELLPNP
jgi:hypothetical protein